MTAGSTCKYPKYENYDDRLKSYVWWPKCLRLRPKLLCEAGFFYTGCGDRVICHACGGGLKDWGMDDPWVEHALVFQDCSYLIDKKGKEFVDKLQKEKEYNQRRIQKQQKSLKLKFATGAPLLEIK